jgi:hypothetical protein
MNDAFKLAQISNPQEKAAVNAPHSRRVATYCIHRDARSVWSACVFSAAFFRTSNMTVRFFCSLFVLATFLPFCGVAQQRNAIISQTGGKLAYAADSLGNRVPDFSHAGYAGGDRAIPEASVRITISPKPGDNTARIQMAIDHVAGLPADANGVRGAVLLLKGRHEVFGGLRMTDSGVVLRGEGAGVGGTVLVAGGQDRRTLIRIAGKNDMVSRTNWQIADDYVPVGATTFRVGDANGLKAGDVVRVIRPSTQAWIDRLGATEFGGGVGGGWKPGTRDIIWERVVKSVEGNSVTINAPITTAIEKEFGQGLLATCDWPGRVMNIGIENLRLESVHDASNAKDENHSWCAITMENAADVWVRQVTFKHFAGSAVAIYESCKNVTVQDCLLLAPISEIGGYRRHTFFTMGQQTLFLRCYAEQGRHDFSVGLSAAGPNAFVQCEAREALADSGPIESWASGVLYDNVVIDGDSLSLGFRPGNNAAVGWAAANSALWNCSASVIRVWNPPGAQNWSFGSWASFEGDGVWRSSNDFMSPDSLYETQLKERLGNEAAARLKLMPRPREESSNPPVDKAQELAAASHQPAPLLKDYIADAGKRDAISTRIGNAIPVESLSPVHSPVSKSKMSLVITNGWVTIDGKLLIGGSANVSWWRGNIRPNEAAAIGLGITRFVPGRIGPGLTDDLNELANTLVARGNAAMDHNYGLWYDRRRDDHERVRRINGDVLPPFYEQPFARSGESSAWDGLSKYDLTKYNPWYWSRLREFASIGEERGLVLFHQNYFQHNILEAGAHWADSPWRSANNINETGFPEPPPYAGDKRIFMAEPFYDVTHTTRRELHRKYIRQCLNNFSSNANVIQFTSAEYTGPLHFTQFWVDTIADWEKENSGKSPVIALSATKDVQDAILADSKRGATVDVIDFRYWWRTERGEFAPPGGKNLAPRQFERQWRGGRPNDVNLAQMATEYRAKYSGKAVICDFDSAGWAWVCAGGSMPRLPRNTDAKLLAAIPRMQPWAEMSREGRGVLREVGSQLLVNGVSELDLSGETGSFRVNTIDARSGAVKAAEIVKAGGKVKLPGAAVVWLVKE